jgi:hypothetical protein
MAEIAPAGGGPNRLFIVIALGLVGLLLLGLIAIGGVFLIPRLLGTSAQPTLRVSVTTPTRVNIAQVTSAPTSTDTPAPTSTSVINTPVIVPQSPAAVTATASVTGTLGTGTPTSGELPQSGMGEDLLLLAGGIVLVLIIVAARRARAPGAA